MPIGRHLLTVTAGALALLAITLDIASAETKTLRFVPQSDLRVFDPVWSTDYVARNHGYMVYDTLFATDAQFRIQPQMVDRWTVSPDGLTWRFTLRDGLKFHNGQPVRSADCIASLERWSKRDAFGQTTAEKIAAKAANDDKTFQIRLKTP
jgi:peptide/nickel transport system substrate-binding protein